MLFHGLGVSGYLRGTHTGESHGQARKKSRGPKGIQLEVGDQRVTTLLIFFTFVRQNLQNSERIGVRT